MTTTTNAKPASAGATFLDISSSRKATNTIATVVVWAAMILAMVPLVWVLWELFARGSGIIFSADWWTTSQRGVMNSVAGGGAAHAIVGTFVQTVLASIISIPIGIFTAIYLVEYSKGGWLGRITTFMVDILSGVPSIVAALFIYALWITVLGQARSGFAVALSLILLMLPVVVRNTEEMLRVVPMDLREASYALGVPKWKTIVRVVVPTAFSGITTGIMLAIARVMGESAPVLILVGSTPIVNWAGMFGQPQSSLPLFMLDMWKSGATGPANDRLWGAALTLVILVVTLNLLARFIAKRFSVKK